MILAPSSVVVGFHFVMKLKLIFLPPFAKTTRRIIFLVPRDATTVKGTAGVVVEKFRDVPLLSSSFKTDSIELWTEDSLLISPDGSSVIFDAPQGETMVVRLVPATSTKRRRGSVKTPAKATGPVATPTSPTLACYACKVEKDRKGDFARRQRNRDRPVCSMCTQAMTTVGPSSFTDICLAE